MIKGYRFGSIVVNNKTYRHDVEVRWTGETLKWQRGKSHLVKIEDIKRAIKQKPEILVIGAGFPGRMRVGKECQAFLAEKGIKLIRNNTKEAVKTFNVISGESEKKEGFQEKVIGLFHLTC